MEAGLGPQRPGTHGIAGHLQYRTRTRRASEYRLRRQEYGIHGAAQLWFQADARCCAAAGRGRPIGALAGQPAPVITYFLRRVGIEPTRRFARRSRRFSAGPARPRADATPSRPNALP